MRSMWENLGRLWCQSTLTQRAIVLGMGFMLLGAFALLALWAGQKEMSLLYTGLSREEAARIVEKIREENIPYELADGGTTVYVPVEQVNPLRLSLAADGLPESGGAGNKILDDLGPGASPTVQRKAITRALEGELARTIRLIEAVASARVHVVQPDSTLFGQSKKATASVVLRLKPGHQLSRGNVTAIANLVAGSVETLEPSEVSIVDSEGNLLSNKPSDPYAEQANTIEEYRSMVESKAVSKAEAMLTRALGPGRAIVRVSADVDTTDESVEMIQFDPDAKVAVQESYTSSVSTSPVPGQADQPAQVGKTSEETSDTKYETTKTITRRRDLAGTVRSYSVAAFVDLRGAGDANSPAITVDQVKAIIANAIGLTNRDTITVVDTKLQDTPVLAAVAGPDAGGSGPLPELPEGVGPWLDLVKRVSLGVLVAGFLVALKIFSQPKRRKSKAKAAAALEGGAAGGKALPGAAAGGALPAPDASPLPFHKQVSTAMRENPDQVRKVFQSWLAGVK